MTLTLRYMHTADIPEVVAIERESFKPAWSSDSYRFEINRSECSYMVVLEQTITQPTHGLRRLLNRVRGKEDETERHAIVGFGGLWKIEDEAHISTIASHPVYRGKSYGEILLAGMIHRAIDLGAGYIVLEVRVSNTVAQNLYHKYHFDIVDIKRGYYQNDNEDAYDMRVELTSANREKLLKLYAAIRAKVPFTDRYSTVKHPRLGR